MCRHRADGRRAASPRSSRLHLEIELDQLVADGNVPTLVLRPGQWGSADDVVIGPSSS
jgi:hypothetical protein